MRWAFFGTDKFSVLVLAELAKAGFRPDLIVSTPDQPQGRHLALTPPPVKIWAEAKQISIIQPASLKKDFAFPTGPWDFFLVASYGKIIPATLLEIPARSVLNIHPSLLPRYRGPSPLQTAILNGDAETGVTIMQVDPEMDHGPIIAQTKIELADNYNCLALETKLATLGAQLFTKTIPGWLAGQIPVIKQDRNQASYTRKFLKTDGELNLADPGLKNYRRYLALHPWPGVFTYARHRGQALRFIIKQAHLDQGQFIIDRVVPAGRQEISWLEFERGLR